MLKARCKILFLFRSFVGGKYLFMILVLLCPAVNVCNTNVDDAVRASGPKTPDEEVTAFISKLRLGNIALNRSFPWSQRCRLCAATGLDERLVAYCRGSERLRGKGGEFIADLIVTQKDQTALLALETMVDRNWLLTVDQNKKTTPPSQIICRSCVSVM